MSEIKPFYLTRTTAKHLLKTLEIAQNEGYGFDRGTVEFMKKLEIWLGDIE